MPVARSWVRDIQAPGSPPDHNPVGNVALHIEVPQSTAEPLRFLLGDWLVDVPGRRLQRGEAVVVLEPRLMAVLCEFCRHPEEVLSAEALLDTCWPGVDSVGDNPVHKAVARLRRALGDCAAAPGHIETIRKRGYRLLAPIRILSEDGARSAGRGWSSGSPFCGLRAFTADHSAVFFGREHEIRSLRDRLATQWRRQCPLVVLLGPSGSGKTSLVQAGLLPAVLRLPMRPTPESPGAFCCCTAATADFATLTEDTPWTLLAGALLDWETDQQPLLSGLSIDHLAGLLSRREPEVLRLLRVGLVALENQRSSVHGQVLTTPPLLVLDCIEAVFQRLTREAQGALIATIGDLVNSGLIVVLAVCRNDFYANLASHPLLMRDKAHGTHMDIAAPDPGAMAQVIRMPARAAGLTYGNDNTGLHRLDDRLCADALQARDALPLLQYTLQELYLRREPGDELTWAAYEALGGLEGAIGSRAEAVLGGLPSARQQALGRLLPRLVGLSADDECPTGRWVPAADLADEDERGLVDALVEARLLVADHVGGVSGYRVAHEALLRRWPRVTNWVTQHRTLLALREDLGPWVRRWLHGGRGRELLLLAGPTLWPVASALVTAPSLFTEDEADFIRRSVARRRHRARLRRGAVVVSLILAVGSCLAAWRFAMLADMAAERERQSQRMASFMLGDLADQLRPIGQLDVLTRIGEHVLGLLGPVSVDDDFTRFSGTPLDRLQRARALVIVGEASGSRGKGHNEASVALLRSARQLLAGREDVRRAAPADYHRTLGAASFWLGQVAFDAGDLTAARADMDLYRQACEAWRTDLPGSAEADKELSFALSSLGSIAVLSGDWRDAAQWYDRSIELKQAAQKMRPEDPELLDAVANTRTWQGLVAYVLGRPGEALQRYDEARTVLLRLWADRPQEQSRLRDLGALEVRRAEALRSLGRYHDAVVVMGEAVTRLRMAEQRDPSNRRWQLERLHAQSGLLIAQIDAGQPVSPSPTVLKQTMQNIGPAAPTESLPQEVLLSLAVAEAAQAVQNGSVGAFRAALDEAESALAVLLRNRPRHWQTLEMQARLRLLELSHLAAIGAEAERGAVSHRTLEALGPAVRGGQAGLLLQAWLAAQSATHPASRGDPGPDSVSLTAGGYQPLAIPTHPRNGHSRL